MQIQYPGHTSNQHAERPVQIKEGDVFRATIKEGRGPNEALLSVRGREFVATFTGGVPPVEKATVQVSRLTSEGVHVNVLSTEQRDKSQIKQSDRDSTRKQGEDQLMRQLGVKQPSPEVSQAVSSILDKGIPLTKEAVMELQRFLQEGDVDKRLQTVQAVANKRLEITSTHLRAVHEALHGRPINDVIHELAKEVNRDFKVEPAEREKRDTNSNLLQSKGDTRAVSVDQLVNVKDMIQRESSIIRAGQQLQQLVSQAPLNKEENRAIEQSMKEASKLEQITRERVANVLQQIEAESTNKEQQVKVRDIRMLVQQDGLSQVVREQIATIQQSEKLSKVLKQASQIQEAGKERLLQVVNHLSELSATRLEEGVTKGSSTFADVLEESRTILQKEANFEQAVQQIKVLLSSRDGGNAEVDLSFNETIEAARILSLQGKEIKARQEVLGAIDHLEQARKAAIYSENEQFQTSVEMASKSIAVTTVTEKLTHMTADFKMLQRDITRILDQANRVMEQYRAQAKVQVKPLLETTIKKLDHAILKSDMMLVADMKTERQLMQASSQLAEARKLLERGEHRRANQIVQEVKNLVERVNFQPSDTKVKHYTAANDRAIREVQLPTQAFSNQVSEIVRGPLQEGSPRSMFEMVRNLGLNRDSEVAQFLAFGREQQQQEASQRNLKTTLMQLAQDSDEESRVQKLANQALSNITGQQLMSRSDQQGNLQSLYFQLPLLLQEKVDNLQVFVNSRNENEQVDWENCSLYFLMETPKMGEIGILVSATERQLAVTLKSDKTDFESKMKPLVDLATERLTEIGYVVKGITYSKLKNEVKQGNETDTHDQQPIFGEKGFDYKI